MESDNGYMVLFLIVVLVFSLVIIFVILEAKPRLDKVKESFHQCQGRNPNGKYECCGNIDWYLGPKKYEKECPGKVPPAFKDMKEYYASLQENFQSMRK